VTSNLPALPPPALPHKEETPTPELPSVVHSWQKETQRCKHKCDAILVTGVAMRLLEYDYAVDNRNGGSNTVRGKSFISPPRWPDNLWSPSNLLLNEYLGLCPGVTQLLRVPHQLPLCSVGVKNEWSYTSSSSYAFMACKGITVFLVIVSTIYIYRLSVFREVKMKLVTRVLQQKCEPHICKHWGEVLLAVRIIRFVILYVYLTLT